MLRVRALAIHQPQPLLLGCESPRVEAPQHPPFIQVDNAEKHMTACQNQSGTVMMKSTTVGPTYPVLQYTPARAGRVVCDPQIVRVGFLKSSPALSDTNTRQLPLTYHSLPGVKQVRQGLSGGGMNFLGVLCPSN